MNGWDHHPALRWLETMRLIRACAWGLEDRCANAGDCRGRACGVLSRAFMR